MKLARRTFLLPLSSILLGAPGRPATNAAQTRVLFVGNSYSFEVPKIFAELCKQTGRDVKVDQITKGGWTFAKHVEGGSAKRFAEGWDVIVIQGQSQEPSFSEEQLRRNSLPAAKELVTAARTSGARALFYETWGHRDGDKRNRPDDTYEAMQTRLIAGYALLAKETGAEIAPIGQAWQTVRKKNPALDLYVKDGSHPNQLGAHLAATVIYTTIFKTDPVKLPALGIPAAAARTLHEAAATAVARMPNASTAATNAK